eukprot:m.178553 g.178553  ORF g.178553 m.178553 type:complete len:63 (+) comp21421_c0_seq8:1903-2091(+)
MNQFSPSLVFFVTSSHVAAFLLSGGAQGKVSEVLKPGLDSAASSLNTKLGYTLHRFCQILKR